MYTLVLKLQNFEASVTEMVLASKVHEGGSFLAPSCQSSHLLCVMHASAGQTNTKNKKYIKHQETLQKLKAIHFDR